MPAPKGRSYTPSRGPLRGQTFTAPAGARGQTAAYNAYQNALARYYGAPSYSALKTERANPTYRVVYERARAKNYDHRASYEAARRIVGKTRIERAPRGSYAPGQHPQGKRMQEIIAALWREGIYDTGDEAADDIYYE